MSYNDTCNEELGLAPQSFAELDFDIFLKDVAVDDYNLSFEQSVIPKLDTTLPDIAPSTLPYIPFEEEANLFDIPPLNLKNDNKQQSVQPRSRPTLATDTKNKSTQPVAQAKQVKNPAKKQRVTKEKEKEKEVKEEGDEKYSKRLQANKKSAQASRERKKALKVELEAKLESLTQENSLLQTQMIQLETENRVLKNEFALLQNVINESSIISKLMSTQVAATIPAKEKSKIAELPASPVKPLMNGSPATPMNVQAAAALYLMVVLHSFGQHQLNSPNSSNLLLPLVTNHLPTAVSVS